uniref:ZP domain-containing protein n=1 Tax=Aceria tosichella TaxID=561515 RepID=A0A6G1SCX3_9ACAR
MRSHSIRRLVASSLSLLLLVVAFQSDELVADGLQQAAGEHDQSGGPIGAASVGANPAGPMLTMSGETSSSIESSVGLNPDDLIAAESSQSPDAPSEHKAFTAAQILRQEGPQHMASVAPVFVAGNQQPQQQPQQAMNQQPVYPQPHMAARLQPPHKANFNPFMAAALAGNYGPAQQQIAAAAFHAQQAGGQVGPPPQHHQHGHHPHGQQPQLHQQQQHHPHQQHPSSIQPGGPHQQQHPQQQQQHHPQQHPHQQQHQIHSPQPQHQHQMIPPAQQQQQASPMAVQESTIRHNVVPAPSGTNGAQFNAADSNSIEMNEVGPQAPISSSQHQQHQASASSPAASQQSSTGLVAASSGQHPVIASASSLTAGAGVGSSSGQEPQAWPLQAPDIPKIVNLEVKCEKNLMKVSVEFDKVFNGVVFSKGHFNQNQCVHVGPNSNKQQAYFDISINSCGTQGNTQNGLYGMGQNTGSGTFFENTIVIQYDPNVQEVYDHARKLRCTWHDQYEKAVTFRPFPVDMLDIVRADFAGDNVGCWMQIQVGKGPWASEVAGIVKIGQTMTMVLAIKDEENKFDMLVRNCFAHDGKRGPIELVDKSGCITRPKLMSRFTKIKNFGSSATVLSYAHFQAFKFPDSMEVHFQCTIQICRHQCPEQCAAGPNVIGGASGSSASENYSESTISGTFNINGRDNQASASASAANTDSMHLRKYGSPALARERRDLNSAYRRWSNGSHHQHSQRNKPLTQSVGLNRIIQVVSTGDLAFAVQRNGEQQQAAPVEGSPNVDAPEASQLTRLDLSNNQICMSSYNFVLALVMLVLILLCSCMLAVSLYVRQRSLLAAAGGKKLLGLAGTKSHSPRTTSSTLSKLFAGAMNTTTSSPSSDHTNQSHQQHHVPSNHHYATTTTHNQSYYHAAN